MNINLSHLTGNDKDNEKLSSINGNLPEAHLVFSGPFVGSASIKLGASPAFDIVIEGRRIQRIDLNPVSARFDLKLPAPLNFNGVTVLNLQLSYASEVKTWTVKLLRMAWLGKQFDAEAKLGEWLSSITEDIPPAKNPLVLKLTKDRHGFPIDDWGLAVSPMIWTSALDAVDTHILNAGIFADSNGHAIFVLIPESNTPHWFEKASPGLNLIGLEHTEFRSKSQEWRIAPLAIGFPLYSGDRSAV